MDTEDNKLIYRFRFGSTKKTVDLNEEEVQLIPYISRLVTYDDILQSCQNENGEYVLNSPIRFNYFQAIFNFLKMKNYSILFDELSEEANVLGMLKLYDFLNLDPVPVPFLKDSYLLRSNRNETENNKELIKYHRATLKETRETAVQFVISLNNNEYNIHDSRTLQTIFSLLMDILSNPSVFGTRICHHTFTVTENCCYSLFNKHEQHQLDKAQRSAQRYRTVENLPDQFHNAFTWKRVLTLEDKQQEKSLFETDSWLDYALNYPIEWPNFTFRSPLRPYLTSWIQAFDLLDPEDDRTLLSIEINTTSQAKLARSGHFNTLPKRPKIDKFKYQYPRKIRKHCS